MLYYAACLRANQFHFSYGRKANRTMKFLMVPASLSQWADEVMPNEVERFQKALDSQTTVQSVLPGDCPLEGAASKRWFALPKLFEVRPGDSLELNPLSQIEDGIPFVARSESNNGVTANVSAPAGVQFIPAGVLSVALGGTPMSTVLQEEPFYCGRDVSYLVPKTPMSRKMLLYYAAACVQIGIDSAMDVMQIAALQSSRFLHCKLFRRGSKKHSHGDISLEGSHIALTTRVCLVAGVRLPELRASGLDGLHSVSCGP